MKPLSAENERQRSMNFYDCIKPLYIFSRLFGLLPFTIHYNSNDHIEFVSVGVFDTIWIMVSIGINLMFANAFLPSIKQPKDFPSQILFIVGRTSLTVGYMVSIMSIAFDLINRNRIKTIFTRLFDFDKGIASFGKSINYERNRRSFMNCILMLALLSSTLAISTYSVYKKIRQEVSHIELLLYHASFIYKVGTSASSTLMFDFLLSCLRARYHLINNLIRECFLDEYKRMKMKNKYFKLNTAEAIGFIQKLANLHSDLAGIMQSVNYSFSFQIMISFSFTFIFTVLAVYTGHRGTESDNKFYYQLSVTYIKYSIMYTLSTIAIIRSGHLVTTQGSEASELLHEITYECKDEAVIACLMQFSQQILHRTPVASCGLFTIDWTLLYEIIPAIISYLTIIMQFDAP